MSNNPETDRSSTENNQAHSEEYGLINANEEIVRDSVRKMMAHTDMCKCDKCFYDACALVLNKMPPRYSTTRKGQLLSLLPNMEIITYAEIGVMAAQAIKMVSESPHH